MFTEEEYSLLSNLPEARRVDEDSEEFQRVVKKFYETIHEYHNKIKIIQVEKTRIATYLYNKYLVAVVCNNAVEPPPPGGETHESTTVQSVQVEKGQHPEGRC